MNQRKTAKTKSAGVRSKAPYIHPNALVETEDIGSGTRIWAFAHVMKGAKIGADCNICDHAFVESNVMLGNNVTIKNGVSVWDGVRIEDAVFVGPNAVFTNDPNPRAEIKKNREAFEPTLIKKGATIGANATIVCGQTLGAYSFVAAGSVVTRDVPDHALVMGVPARVTGWICRCANRLKLSGSRAKCGKCGRSYKKIENGLREA